MIGVLERLLDDVVSILVFGTIYEISVQLLDQCCLKSTTILLLNKINTLCQELQNQPRKSLSGVDWGLGAQGGHKQTKVWAVQCVQG